MEPDTSRTLTVEEIIRALWRALPPVTLITLGSYLVFWGWPSAEASQWVTATLLLLAVYLVAIVVHELLHILPMFAAGIKPSDLSFGVRWSEGVVFVHGGRPVSVRAYRVILATPGIVLGILPAIYGVAMGNAFVVVFAWLMLISAIGDWAVLRLIADLPHDQMVQDHATEIGCVIVQPETHAE